MNKIVSLILGDKAQIDISSTSSLESISCCDDVAVVLQAGNKHFKINEAIMACDLDLLKKGLEIILSGEQQVFSFVVQNVEAGKESSDQLGVCCQKDDQPLNQDLSDDAVVITIYVDRCINYSIEIGSLSDIFFKKTVAEESLKDWISQLDLLNVLTEENEKEKSSRGSGCC